MNKYIVTTTIFEPSEAIMKFSEMKDWTLVIAGDNKTPHHMYSNLRCIYLHPDTQQELYPQLSSLIGWNSIQRRNIALLHAYKLGADIVALVDDDNIPLDGWGENLLIGKEIECKVYTPKKVPFFDPFSCTNYKNLWHRGFPIQYIAEKNELDCTTEKIIPDVQADFWNGDPDVDAICRMEHAPDCTFDDSDFPFSSSVLSPFNSQNTFLTRKVIPDYLCIPYIGRMDDIWGSYYCQMKGGHKIIYNRPSVVQKRNGHNLTTDFKGEIMGYTDTYKISDVETLMSIIPEKSQLVIEEYINSTE